jgi:DNA modification methylase
MDPFTGLGSTAVACARLGVNFIGADLDETYLAQAVARTRDAYAATQPGARRANNGKKALPARATRMGKADLSATSAATKRLAEL